MALTVESSYDRTNNATMTPKATTEQKHTAAAMVSNERHYSSRKPREYGHYWPLIGTELMDSAAAIVAIMALGRNLGPTPLEPDQLQSESNMLYTLNARQLQQALKTLGSGLKPSEQRNLVIHAYSLPGDPHRWVLMALPLNGRIGPKGWNSQVEIEQESDNECKGIWLDAETTRSVLGKGVRAKDQVHIKPHPDDEFRCNLHKRQIRLESIVLPTDNDKPRRISLTEEAHQAKKAHLADGWITLGIEDLPGLAQSLRYCLPATDPDATRYALSSVCLEARGQNVHAVATDGRRLHLCTLKPSTTHHDKEELFLLPHYVVHHVLRMLNNATHGARLLVSKNKSDHYRISLDSASVSYRMEYTNFPDYKGERNGKNVIPRHLGCIDIPKAEVIESLKACVELRKAIKDEQQRGVCLQWQGKTLAISNPTLGYRSEHSCTCRSNPQRGYVWLDAEWLLQAIEPLEPLEHSNGMVCLDHANWNEPDSHEQAVLVHDGTHLDYAVLMPLNNDEPRQYIDDPNRQDTPQRIETDQTDLEDVSTPETPHNEDTAIVEQLADIDLGNLTIDINGQPPERIIETIDTTPALDYVPYLRPMHALPAPRPIPTPPMCTNGQGVQEFTRYVVGVPGRSASFVRSEAPPPRSDFPYTRVGNGDGPTVAESFSKEETPPNKPIILIECRQPDGSPAPYRVEIIRLGEHYRITPLGSEQGYDAGQFNGRCECSCPDYRYRRADKGEHCKHLAALQAAGLLATDPTPPTTPPTDRHPRYVCQD